MPTTVGCPRCHDEKIKEDTIDATKTVNLKRYNCNNCGSRFFFEEDILPLIFMLNKT